MANNSRNPDKEDFIYPRGSYRGEFTPTNLIIDANLQEFAQKIALICALESNGKVTPLAAYEEIKQLWEQLEKSAENHLYG